MKRDQLGGFGDFLLSLGGSCLPKLYRDRWIGPVTPDLARGALLTGVAQAVVCLALFIAGYFRWLAYLGRIFAEAAVRQGLEISERDYAAGVGMTALVSYMVRPTTLLLVYFTVEGVARFTAAIATGEAVPTLPLALAALVQRRLERRRQEKYWGICVADVVETCSADCDLRVRSCRAKDWGSLVTLCYRGELYVVAGEESAPAPRRFVYRLKKLPRGTVVHGLREYDPEEVLNADR